MSDSGTEGKESYPNSDVLQPSPIRAGLPGALAFHQDPRALEDPRVHSAFPVGLGLPVALLNEEELTGMLGVGTTFSSSPLRTTSPFPPRPRLLGPWMT